MLVEVKNKEQLTNCINEMFKNYGTGKDISKILDDAIFEFIRLMTAEQTILGENDFNTFYVLKDLRDMFINVETKQIQPQQ